MDELGPFANWPNLNASPSLSGEQSQVLETDTAERGLKDMASRNNALENFLGGAPLNVVARLFFISLVVGALLMWLELRPIDILRGVQAFFDRIYQLGFGAIQELASYVLAGAVFVVPAWFVLRLANLRSGKR
ncbi:MAG: hypothetical protein EBS82_05180 [Methylocystaceae bacterium]|jgi:Family of unknown function (DUF6460)|nr:hypothetical protein [Methylocystaceae bacterium]NBT96502.1 hypothetical protein [Methylocystaceae bacterium]